MEKGTDSPDNKISADVVSAAPLFTDSSGYRFYPLASSSLPSLRSAVLSLQKQHHSQVHGTILLSTEGTNVRLSGPSHQIAFFKLALHKALDFDVLNYKDTPATVCSLPRFLVKIKKELISMGQVLDPALLNRPSPAQHITAASFRHLSKTATESGAPFTILDTRNAYEVSLGKLNDAVHLDINTFREFPDAVASNIKSDNPLPKDKPILMYCTGGIRCEKAAHAMVSAGYSSSLLYQLSGGILSLLADSPSRSLYSGGCFVFDDRIVVNPDLSPTHARTCFSCRSHPLFPSDLTDRPDVFACPKCDYPDYLNTNCKRRKKNT